METITTLHGYRYAVSMAGSVMGRGADLIIGDDPMSSASAPSEAVRKTEVNLWMTAHRTRLNNKREGAIVLVMQRLHQNDLVGHVLGSEDWEVLSIPAIATDPAAYRIGPDSEDVYNRQLNEVLHPEREPLDVLEATRRKSALPEMPVAGPCAMAGRGRRSSILYFHVVFMTDNGSSPRACCRLLLSHIRGDMEEYGARK